MLGVTTFRIRTTTGSLCTSAAPFVSYNSGSEEISEIMIANYFHDSTSQCSIISHLEESDEDTLSFFTKSGLDSKVDFLSSEVKKRNPGRYVERQDNDKLYADPSAER